MRKDELKTIISNAHKATVLCEHASGNQGFLMGLLNFRWEVLPFLLMNYLMEQLQVPLIMCQGTSEAAQNSKYAQPRQTLNAASSSDSASSQKWFNKVKDEENFGPTTLETIDLIESFSSMYLGVNLCKAFLSGI